MGGEMKVVLGMSRSSIIQHNGDGNKEKDKII